MSQRSCPRPWTLTPVGGIETLADLRYSHPRMPVIAISGDVPVVSCDARNRESTKNVLISLVEYVLTMRRSRAVAPA